MSEELEKKYKRTKARWEGASNPGVRYLATVFIIVILYSISSPWMNANIPQFISVINAIIWIYIIVGFIVAIVKTKQPPYETVIFMRIYETLENLDFYLEDQSRIHLEKAIKRLRDALRSLSQLTSVSSTRSTLFEQNFIRPLKNLRDNLKMKILPIVRNGDTRKIKEPYGILKSLAEVFSDPTDKLTQITELNARLDSIPQPAMEEMGIKSRFVGFWRRKSGQFLGSIIIGYSLEIIVITIYCYLLRLDFATFAHDNPYIMLGIGAIFSTGIMAFLRK